MMTRTRLIRPRDPGVTSKIMAAVRGKHTEPECALRSALFRRGLRFRVQYGRLPGRPDIVFPHQRVAVFVDGDFWHGAGWRERGFLCMEAQFGRNAAFWIGKIHSNVERDRRVNAELTTLGWKVIRLWESEIRRATDRCALRVERAVLGRRRAR